MLNVRYPLLHKFSVNIVTIFGFIVSWIENYSSFIYHALFWFCLFVLRCKQRIGRISLFHHCPSHVLPLLFEFHLML